MSVEGICENVANYYRSSNKGMVAPYAGWYNFQIPQINIDIVKRDLLSIQEIAGYFGVNEYSVKELLKKGNVPSYLYWKQGIDKETRAG